MWKLSWYYGSLCVCTWPWTSMLLSPMLGILSKMVKPWDCLKMPKMQSICTIWNQEIFCFKLRSKGVGCFDNLTYHQDVTFELWNDILSPTLPSLSSILQPPCAKTLFLAFSHSYYLALMVGGVKLELSPTIIELFLLALPTKSRILCFRFILDYSSLRDFRP